jgi:predicted RNA-binding Zn-ribbon protein involved in translation (DUF1610 family)
MPKCEHCNSTLKTEKSLERHIKTNKRCLSSRLLINDFKCSKCGLASASQYHHNIHFKGSCDNQRVILFNQYKKSQSELEEYKKESYTNILENKKLTAERNAVELENEQLLSDNINLERQFENTILDLKKEIEDYKKQIFSIASQPKNTTNTTTNNNQTNIKVDKMLVASLTEDLIKLKADQFMQIKHIDNGIKGYADFMIEHLPGTIACTDVSRNILKYKDEKNEIHTDTGGIQTGKLFFNGISPAATKLFTERYDYLHKLDITEERRLEMVNILIDNRSKMNSIVRGDIEGEKERRDWAKYIGSQCKV